MPPAVNRVSRELRIVLGSCGAAELFLRGGSEKRVADVLRIAIRSRACKTRDIVFNAIEIEKIRSEFPILSALSGKRPLVYLDNAATAQKPQCVIDAVSRFYSGGNANIHRGLYRLSAEATAAFERARESVARFINAREARECIFTRGATEAINLVAASWGMKHLREGDEILLTQLEHHADIVPWQLVAERTGAKIVAAPILPNGELDVPAWKNLLTERTRFVGITAMSNALGVVNPVKELVAAAHAVGALALVDGAQSVAHGITDVREIDCDFFVFSGHKVFGPTGIGVLYGRAEILNAMPPYQGGGDMIEKVDFSGTTFREIPERFEAGTPNICGAVALGVALDYFLPLRLAAAEHEAALLRYATEKLAAVPGLKIFGDTPNKASVISFQIEGIHPSDIGTMLDTYGIAVRVGHHCAMPLMKALGVTGTVRASFAFYNTFAEVDAFVDALLRIQKMF